MCWTHIEGYNFNESVHISIVPFKAIKKSKLADYTKIGVF